MIGNCGDNPCLNQLILYDLKYHILNCSRLVRDRFWVAHHNSSMVFIQQYFVMLHNITSAVSVMVMVVGMLYPN